MYALDTAVDDLGALFLELLARYPHLETTIEWHHLKRIISNRDVLFDEVKSVETPLIVVDPDIMLGKPVIAGTRITVELILEKMAAGQTIDQILEDYPQLTREGVLAARKVGVDRGQHDDE